VVGAEAHVVEQVAGLPVGFVGGFDDLAAVGEAERDATLVGDADDAAAALLPAAHVGDRFGEHDDVLGAVDEPAELGLAVADGAVEVEEQDGNLLHGCSMVGAEVMSAGWT